MELEDFPSQLGDIHELNDSKILFSNQSGRSWFSLYTHDISLGRSGLKKATNICSVDNCHRTEVRAGKLLNSKQGFSPLYENVRSLSPVLCGRGCNIQMKIGSSDTAVLGRTDCLATGNGS